MSANAREHFPFRPHPWHGLSPGPKAPDVVRAYIELTPFDWVKYEIDKESGYLRVDRPQRASSQPPTLYGFIPRTFCGERVGAMMPGAERGDHDPLDVCVFSERPIARSEILVDARVIGGLEMLDGREADDKIVAVLELDDTWGGVRDIDELPEPFVERLVHYFTTYKNRGATPADVEIRRAYGREHALAVVRAAVADYEDTFRVC